MIKHLKLDIDNMITLNILVPIGKIVTDRCHAQHYR